MSAKKKRRRRGATAKRNDASVSATGGGAAADSAQARPDRPVDDRAGGRPRGLFGALSASPYPGLGASMARGLRVVGASPVILATAFLSLLATWAVFLALSVVVTPRFLAVLMALLPANLFSDVPVAFGAAGSTGLIVAYVAALGAIRSVTYGLLTIMVVRAMRGTGPDLRASLRRLPRVAAVLLALYLLEVALVVALIQVLAGLLGSLTILGAVAAMYFLVMVPVVAAAEDASVQEALRRGFRAARLPGTRHLALVMGYFLFLFWISAVTPFGVVAPATPTILTWVFALGATFVHASVLGALAYRWLAVRDQVPAAPERSAPRARAARSP